MTALRTLLDFPGDVGLATAVAWLIAALRDRGPYPVLVLAGEAGAGKSTFMAMLQALIDPSVARLRSLPRGEPALLRAAHDSHVLAFDNLSSLPGWLSDALCRMVSGGGYASRRDGGAAEVGLAGVARPVMMNGIADIVTRPDLADRALFVTLNGIQPRNRRTEAELWAGFEAARPRLLGALLDAVAEGLCRLPKTTLAEAPRMADLARWVEACEPTLFKPGAFKTIYLGNRNGAARDAIECDAFVDAACEFAWRTKTWFGTASDLYRQMAPLAAGDDGWGRAWPGNARALASRLRQGAAFLRRCGVEVAFDRARLGTRIISLAIAVNGASDANRPADANPGTASPGASPASA